MKLITALFGTMTIVCVWAYAAGDRSAINGVIGSGFMTLVCGVLAVVDR